MKKLATIDIGTNSMRLLLAEVADGKLTYRQKEVNTTRIGKSVDNSGSITEEGINKNLKTFCGFVKQAKAWGAEEIAAIATSAVRDAANGKEFAELAFKEAGVEIKIISGEEEALLGYRGVLMGAKEVTASILVIDVGGGSTELIVGDSRKILYSVSLDMGAVRMTERVINSDPISPAEEEILKKEIRRIFNKVSSKLNFYRLERLIGIGGTATTIAAIHQGLEPYDPDKVHQYSLSLMEIKELLKRLKQLPLEERKGIKGLHPKRADIIIAGIQIIVIVMEELGIESLSISEYDNLEGMLVKE